ncbi:hypothetical protein [Sphingobium sp. TomTYG45]
MDISQFAVASALLAEDPAIRSRAAELLDYAQEVVARLRPEELSAMLAVIAARLEQDGISLFKPIPH